jgi:pre-mRNA-splicing factor ISY1
MARNQEKAQSMLNRWRTMKKDQNMKLNASIREQYERLPRRPAEAATVAECERARMSLLRHIGQKVMEIQNGI